MANKHKEFIVFHLFACRESIAPIYVKRDDHPSSPPPSPPRTVPQRADDVRRSPSADDDVIMTTQSPPPPPPPPLLLSTSRKSQSNHSIRRRASDSALDVISNGSRHDVTRQRTPSPQQRTDDDAGATTPMPDVFSVRMRVERLRQKMRHIESRRLLNNADLTLMRLVFGTRLLSYFVFS